MKIKGDFEKAKKKELKMKKKSFTIIAAIVLTLVLLGCPSQPEETEADQTSEVTKVEDEKITPQEEIKEVETEEMPVFKVIRIQFNPNSSIFQDTEKAMLLSYTSVLQEYPELKLQIKGHTAKVGSEETSQSLSEKRAREVANFILTRTNIDESRLRIIGMGSREPQSDNDTENGRALNRRVEVSLIE